MGLTVLARNLILAVCCLVAQDVVASAAAVEFYNADLDEYFVTADAPEVAALASGMPPGWVKTGYAFSVADGGSVGMLPVCRFFSASFAPKSSHFYTPYAAECASLANGSVWTYESIAFYLGLPASEGDCGPGRTAIYRMYNNGAGGAPNHRYTSAPEVLARMRAKGWTVEGDARTGVFACGPAAPSGTSDIFQIVSTTNGRTYDVVVDVPAGYDAHSAPLPVIYALDAQIRYQSLVDTVKAAGANVILVQIYDGGLRQTDFNVPGAYPFLQFLKRDLIPHVESKYRADPARRVISGLSTGGNFPFHALYYETPGPWTFAHYWSNEGAFWQQWSFVNDEEQRMFELIGPRAFPVTLLLGAGTGNWLWVQALHEALARRNYPALQLVFFFSGLGHVPSDVPTFVEGLRLLCGTSKCFGLEH